MDTDEGNVESHLPMSQAVGDGVSTVRSLSTRPRRARKSAIKCAILFGAPMRDMESHFARLEERLQKDLTELKDETRGRLESLEVFLRKEIESLTDQLESGAGGAPAGGTNVHPRSSPRRSKPLTNAPIRQKNTSSKHGVSCASTSWINPAHSVMSFRTLSELSETTDHRVRELRAEKIDRATLAVLLTELAMRLGDGFCCRGTSDPAPEMRHGQTTRRLSSAPRMPWLWSILPCRRAMGAMSDTPTDSFPETARPPQSPNGDGWVNSGASSLGRTDSA